MGTLFTFVSFVTPTAFCMGRLLVTYTAFCMGRLFTFVTYTALCIGRLFFDTFNYLII